MRRWLPLLCALLLAGCASSPEVKQASGDVALALAALDEAEGDFRDIYLRELDDTQELVERAIVADAVKRLVDGLAAEEIDGNLIVLSTAIRAERDAYRELTAMVSRARPRTIDGEPETPTQVVQRVLEKKADELHGAADQLDAGGHAESAAALRLRADQLASGADGFPQFGDMEVLVILTVAKSDVRDGSRALGAYVDLMRAVHAQVNEWIATDVTVRGEQVASLIDRHAATLGLANGGDTGADAGGPDGDTGGTP